jgi:dephospho-CoA kinase
VSGGGGRPRIIGVTGTIASGKSTVAAMLAARGAEVIDGDRVYRELLSPGSPLMGQLADRFGRQIVMSSGDLDRPALGKIVFNDPGALADLDALTHPAIVAETRRRIERSAAPVVVVEAVKLAQTDLVDDLDALWLVTANPDVRLERLMTRSGLDAESASARIAAFPDPVPAGIGVDVIIDNSGDLDALQRQVETAWETFLARHVAGGEWSVVSMREGP